MALGWIDGNSPPLNSFVKPLSYNISFMLRSRG